MARVTPGKASPRFRCSVEKVTSSIKRGCAQLSRGAYSNIRAHMATRSGKGQGSVLYFAVLIPILQPFLLISIYDSKWLLEQLSSPLYSSLWKICL